MKRTQKYSKACQILTFPHKTQEDLYSELNRLGWYWKSQKQEWIRDDTPANEATNLVRVRVWTATAKVEQAAELFAEDAEAKGLRLIEKSRPYANRPPNQNDSRIYLTFEDISENS